jgi:membrane associated rhomboid family serine protease
MKWPRKGGEAAAQRGEAERRRAPAKQGGEAAAQRGEAERRRAPAKLALPDWLALPAWLSRLPAVSLGLVVLCLLVNLIVQVGFASERRNVERQLREAVSFVIHNPVVEIDARLLPAVRAVMPTFESNEMFAFLRKKRPRSDETTPQERFEMLAARAFDALDSHPYRVLGVVPADLSVYGSLSHPFVHSGWLHLLGTLLLFLLAGPMLEDLWGRRVFAASLALLAVVSAGVFALAHIGADRALVGASAVVAGLVAAVLVRFRGQEVDFLRWLAPFSQVELSAPAWALAVPWAAYEILLWWMVQGALPGGVDNAVGYTAHAAGALLGGLLPLGIARLGWEGRDGCVPQAVVKQARAERFDFRNVLEARAAGDADGAFAMLEAELHRSARNRDAVTTFWEMAIERGVAEEAAPFMLQLVREELRRGAEEVAVAQWREVAQHLPTAFLDPPTLLQLVPIIGRLDGDEHAVLALQQALDERNEGLTPAAAVLAAGLAAELAPELAVDAARRALASQTLEQGLRLELEQLVARLAPREDEAPREPEKPEPAPSVFYEESDRSAFGDVGDLSALDDSFPEGAVSEAVPRAVEAELLRIEVAGQGQTGLSYTRLRAVAVAGVHGLGPKPVVLIDLLVDGAGTEGPLRVIRLRSNRFDPRRLAPGVDGALDALRWLVQELLSRSDAQPLPDPDGAAARPVRIFRSLEEYHEQVLRKAARDLG